MPAKKRRQQLIVAAGVVVVALVVTLVLIRLLGSDPKELRYDQLMDLGWKLLIPLALINIFLTACLKAVVS